jgi:MoaA/NifB/PqqE/SkfB family radical SAM enzyme
VKKVIVRKLKQNIYNRDKRQDELKVKVWRYAGLMLTYKCPAACEFCYYNCSPEKEGLMPIETALNAWQSLVDLSGTSAEIHITGGEPFVYFDHLVELLARAHERKLIGLDAVETNAYWATDRQTVVKRLEILKAYGMKRLKISWDPFHAEYIDEGNVILLADTAKEILGPDNVQVRWDKYLGSDLDMKSMDFEQRAEVYKQMMGEFPIKLTGRSSERLSAVFADKSIDQITKKNCDHSFMCSKGVHIDPYGNVFCGICSGITVGNVNEKSLVDIWKDYDPTSLPFVSGLVKGSPVALLDEAVEMGFKIKSKYAGKCHLCCDMRQFFFDNKHYHPVISPAECYM